MNSLIAGLLLLLAPPPPAAHARYGPLTQCLNGFAVTATGSESIVAMEGGFTLASQAGGFHIHLGDDGYHRAQEQASDVEVAGLGRLVRYQGGGGTATEATTTYLIPGAGGRPSMLVNSTDFDGSPHDLVILGRLSRVRSDDECGNFEAPAYPGESLEAGRWLPDARPGPFFLCRNGIGFPILAGEAVQATLWRRLDDPALRISLPNPIAAGLEPVHLLLHGPREPVSGTGTVTASFRPQLERMNDGLAILLMPPLTERISYGQDPRFTHWIEIDYPQGQEAIARAFAARMLFVANDDPRCGAD